MVIRAICVALLLSSLPIAGCGTVANLATQGPEGGGKTPFGGIRQDVTCMKTAANGESAFGLHPASGAQPRPQIAPLVFAAADLPLSFIGDVVTWPYTASYTWINQPVPVPPVLLPPGLAPPPTFVAPENNEPEKKAPEKGKQRDDKPAQLPPPQPKESAP